MIKVNLSEVKMGDFEPVPEGRYLVAVESIEHSFYNEKPRLSWRFRIIEPVERGSEDAVGRIVFDTTWLTDKALWRLKMFLLAFGFYDSAESELEVVDDLDPRKDMSNPDFEFDPEELIGMEALADVGIEEYESDGTRRRRNRVERLMAVSFEELYGEQ